MGQILRGLFWYMLTMTCTEWESFPFWHQPTEPDPAVQAETAELVTTSELGEGFFFIRKVMSSADVQGTFVTSYWCPGSIDQPTL